MVKVLTDEKPYRYVLQILIDQSRVSSYFSSSEMALAQLKDLRANKVIQHKMGKHGMVWYLVSFRRQSDTPYLR